MSTKLEDHNDLCVGIDLGTTNSVLATINEKPNGDIVSKVVDIARAVDMYSAMSGEAKLTTQKRPTLPSCIYYRQEKNYEPIIGDFAKMQYPLRPHLVAKSIKSQMGRPLAEGLSPDVPDKTPAQISSRILKHMLKEVAKVYRCEITDAVITVPANFDSAMCKATRDAAEYAGIKVKNADGSERPVLLSEPNAVIYDLINQIHNGEISNHILDLSEKKRVLVFDLGGGTLDITIHEIKRREDNNQVLKVDEIATNRYTLLGGDDFDEEIAKEMYKHYLKQYENHPDVVLKLRQEEKVIMSSLRSYAEDLKLQINQYSSEDYSSGWDMDDDEEKFPIGGNMGYIGYAYDDTFTKEEVEKILSVFMGTDLKYDDYKHLETIKDTRNIIYPILDVLKKASDKLGVSDVNVDAVIVNGGMSKFYMVTDRLKEFFGFEPIVALDPDQAVARGAAVYHYYLHKYEEMKDDMKMIGNVSSSDKNASNTSQSLFEQRTNNTATHMAIQWGNTILNDCLYLGAKNGAVHEIIPTGAELPYTSKVMTGFKIEPGQSKIAIPIKSQNIDGTYRTIATGNISFKQHYNNGAYVAFIVHMGSNKVITMKAWTSKDITGNEKLEEGYVEIAIDNEEKSKIKNKFIAPLGSKLQPKEEINNMLQLCQNYENCKNKVDKSNIAKRISGCVMSICNAGNKEEFAEVIIDKLSTIYLERARERLFTISRKIASTWSEEQRKKLASLCISQLSTDISGYFTQGQKVCTNIQAIFTLSACGNIDQLNKLSTLHQNSSYLQACLYTHANTKTDIEWIEEQFEKDVKKVLKYNKSNIQFSAYSIAIVLRKDDNNNGIISVKSEEKIVKKLIKAINSGNLNNEELVSCILALGWICDQRSGETEIDSCLISEVLDTLRDLSQIYNPLTILKQERVNELTVRMINGEELSEDEEQFLLTKLEF